MRAWIELLPLFIVRRLALKHCERLPSDGIGAVVTPRPGVYFRASSSQREQEGGRG